MTVLNSTQQKLAADNYHLIYGFLRHHQLDENEYVDLLMIALCNAAATYKTEKEKCFSTYAYKCMLNEVKRHTNQEKAKKRIPVKMILSYDEKISDGEDEITFKDTLLDRTAESKLTDRIYRNELLSNLSEREQEIALYLEAGFNQSEIAKKLGVSHSRVGVIIRRMRKKLEVA